LSRPLPDLTLFLDENFGTTTVADTLRKAEIKVEVLADHFTPGTPDETWLPQVGKRGWVVVTKDKRIRHRQVEREALLGAGVTSFVLSSGEIDAKAMAAILIATYPRMRKLVRDYEPPFIATVYPTGSVKMLTDPARRADVRKELRADSAEKDAP